MEHGCSLATVAANGEPALVGTTWTLLCPLIYHLFIFFCFDFFLRHEQHANGAFFYKLECLRRAFVFCMHTYLIFLIPQAEFLIVRARVATYCHCVAT